IPSEEAHILDDFPIKSELELPLFEVRNVINVQQKTSKGPLLLFSIDIEPTDFSNDIFKVLLCYIRKFKSKNPTKRVRLYRIQMFQNNSLQRLFNTPRGNRIFYTHFHKQLQTHSNPFIKKRIQSYTPRQSQMQVKKEVAS
ncbi:PRE C2HC domain-containing protein, partial [Aphis craccivora]